MTAKTSPGRFLRRRSFHFAGTRNWLLAVGVFVLVGAQASAFTAYVSNEKSNTISVVDTDKFTVVKTIKVGQRPRGIELTKAPMCGTRRATPSAWSIPTNSPS